MLLGGALARSDPHARRPAIVSILFPDAGSSIAQAREINSAAAAAVKAATNDLQDVKRQIRGVQDSIASLGSQIDETQQAYDNTFFLNFGKRGELNDQIQGLKKQVSKAQSDLNKLSSTEDKAAGMRRTAVEMLLAISLVALRSGGPTLHT